MRDTDGEVRLEGVVTFHVVWKDIPLDRGSGRWLLFRHSGRAGGSSPGPTRSLATVRLALALSMFKTITTPCIHWTGSFQAIPSFSGLDNVDVNCCLLTFGTETWRVGRLKADVASTRRQGERERHSVTMRAISQ